MILFLHYWLTPFIIELLHCLCLHALAFCVLLVGNMLITDANTCDLCAQDCDVFDDNIGAQFSVEPCLKT